MSAPLPVGIGLLFAAAVGAAHADYPSRPVRILVGFTPGGGTDIIARSLGQKFAEAWGKPVVVENLPGVGGSIAAERVAKAAPDGHTLLLTTGAAIVVNPSLFDKPGFDPVRDLAPISQVCLSANVLTVGNDVPAHSVQELVALARAQPGKLTFGSAGIGTSMHLGGEVFKSMAGIDIAHVPYRGATAALPDVVAGRVTMYFGVMASTMPLVRDGRLRPLAVTSAQRSAAAPELPTMAEAGFPGFDVTLWFGLLTTAGTPEPVIRQIHRETLNALASPDVRMRLADVGMELIGSSPEAFGEVIRAEIPKWAKVIKDAGAKPN